MCNKTIVRRYQKALEELQTMYASDMEDIEKGKIKHTGSQYKDSID